VIINPNWDNVELLFDAVTCWVDGEVRRYPVPGWMCKRCHVFFVGEYLPQSHMCMIDGEWLTVKGMQVVKRILERKEIKQTTGVMSNEDIARQAWLDRDEEKTMDVVDEARQVAVTHAAKDNSLEIVQDLATRYQPKEENWQFVTTQTYALPGRWVWIVLLCREVGMASDGRMEVRMKAEMVVGEEGEGGKLGYLLKDQFDE